MRQGTSSTRGLPKSAKAWGICKVCAGKYPADAERRFRERVTELGAEVLEPVWLGALTPHRVRCKEGYIVSPRPVGVMSGQGLCRVCAGSEWDVFYVVADTLGRLVKFGVTSGDPAPRLADHARAGLTEKLRILPGLPKGGAPDMERAVLFALEVSGMMPVRGREYFDFDALPIILATVIDTRGLRQRYGVLPPPHCPPAVGAALPRWRAMLPAV